VTYLICGGIDNNCFIVIYCCKEMMRISAFTGKTWWQY